MIQVMSIFFINIPYYVLWMVTCDFKLSTKFWPVDDNIFNDEKCTLMSNCWHLIVCLKRDIKKLYIVIQFF